MRDFKNTEVDGPVFTEVLPAFDPGTYRIFVMITDSTGVVAVLDYFPPLTVPDR